MQQSVLDKETFSALVVRHQTALFRAARAILPTDEDAEDAVQEAVCAAFAHRDTLRDAEKFKPWMLRILTNKCYDCCRRRRPTVSRSRCLAVFSPAAVRGGSLPDRSPSTRSRSSRLSRPL